MSEKERHKYNISASYTVEASFIVPMILGLIFAMIYMLFFLHDRVVLHQNLQMGLIAANNKTVNYKELNKKNISKNMIILEVRDLSYNSGPMYITAQVKAVSKIDIPVITYFMDRKKIIRIKIRQLKIRPDSMVRKRQQRDKLNKGEKDGGE